LSVGGGRIACVCQRFRAMTVSKFIAPLTPHPSNTRPLPATRRDLLPPPPSTICWAKSSPPPSLSDIYFEPPHPTRRVALPRRRGAETTKMSSPRITRESLMKRERINRDIIIIFRILYAFPLLAVIGGH